MVKARTVNAGANDGHIEPDVTRFLPEFLSTA